MIPMAILASPLIHITTCLSFRSRVHHSWRGVRPSRLSMTWFGGIGIERSQVLIVGSVLVGPEEEEEEEGWRGWCFAGEKITSPTPQRRRRPKKFRNRSNNVLHNTYNVPFTAQPIQYIFQKRCFGRREDLFGKDRILL